MHCDSASDGLNNQPTKLSFPPSTGEVLPPGDAVQMLLNGRQAIACDQPAVAIRWLMSGMDLAQATGDLDSLTVAMSDLAIVYRELGEHDLARRFQQRVINQQTGSDAADLMALANDAFNCQEFDLAKELAATAATFETSKSPLDKANSLGMRGLIAAANNRPKQGLRLLFQARTLHHVSRDLLGEGKDWLNMAEVFTQLGRYRGTRSALRRAVHCFSQIASAHFLPLARQRLAQIDRCFQRASSPCSAN